MLTLRVFFLTILTACCIAFVGCDRMEQVLEPAPEDPRVSENTVSLAPTTDITAVAVGEKIKIDLKIAGGTGVAGYGALFVFDETALKYINTTPGDYLPSGGIWMSPELGNDENYQVRLTIGDSTTVGEVARFEVAPDVPEAAIAFSIDEVLFQIPETQLPPELASPGAVYSAFSILASSPLGTDTKPIPVDGDGTLATLTFEVIEAKPGLIHLREPNLSNTDDEPLAATVQSGMIIVNAPAAP